MSTTLAEPHVPESRRADIAIGGMTCAACVQRVEKAIRRQPGVLSASVNLATEKAEVEGHAGLLRPAELVRAVEAAGYEADILTGDSARDAELAARDEARMRHETARTVLALALAAPLMLPMVGVALPPWVQLLLALPVQFGLWLRELAHGNLGESIFLQRPVAQALWERAEPTALLSLMAIAIVVWYSVPASRYSITACVYSCTIRSKATLPARNWIKSQP